MKERCAMIFRCAYCERYFDEGVVMVNDDGSLKILCPFCREVIEPSALLEVGLHCIELCPQHR